MARHKPPVSIAGPGPARSTITCVCAATLCEKLQCRAGDVLDAALNSQPAHGRAGHNLKEVPARSVPLHLPS